MKWFSPFSNAEESLVQVYVQEGKDLQSVSQGDFFR